MIAILIAIIIFPILGLYCCNRSLKTKLKKLKLESKYYEGNIEIDKTQYYIE